MKKTLFVLGGVMLGGYILKEVIVTVSKISFNIGVCCAGNNLSTKPNEQKKSYFEFDNRSDAEKILFDLTSLINDYGHCTISDAHDLIGKHTVYKETMFGWTNLKNAEIIKERGRYIIQLPDPEAIK